MKSQIFSTYYTLSTHTSNRIIDVINDKPDTTLCIAGGHSPLQTIRLLVEAHLENRVDLSQVTFIQLDEWVGFGKEDQGSCSQFLYEELFIPASISEDHIHFFNAKSTNLESECTRMDQVIFKYGVINFMLLGIGMNGHLGFNEPNVSFDQYSHLVNLDNTTKKVGQKYFDTETVISQGITLGGKHILNAKEVVLIANGKGKSSIVKQTLASSIVDKAIPATLLLSHPNAHFWIDKDAASLL